MLAFTQLCTPATAARHMDGMVSVLWDVLTPSQFNIIAPVMAKTVRDVFNTCWAGKGYAPFNYDALLPDGKAAELGLHLRPVIGVLNDRLGPDWEVGDFFEILTTYPGMMLPRGDEEGDERSADGTGWHLDGTLCDENKGFLTFCDPNCGRGLLIKDPKNGVCGIKYALGSAVVCGAAALHMHDNGGGKNRTHMSNPGDGGSMTLVFRVQRKVPQPSRALQTTGHPVVATFAPSGAQLQSSYNFGGVEDTLRSIVFRPESNKSARHNGRRKALIAQGWDPKYANTVTPTLTELLTAAIPKLTTAELATIVHAPLGMFLGCMVPFCTTNAQHTSAVKLARNYAFAFNYKQLLIITGAAAYFAPEVGIEDLIPILSPMSAVVHQLLQDAIAHANMVSPTLLEMQTQKFDKGTADAAAAAAAGDTLVACRGGCDTILDITIPAKRGGPRTVHERVDGNKTGKTCYPCCQPCCDRYNRLSRDGRSHLMKFPFEAAPAVQ